MKWGGKTYFLLGLGEDGTKYFLKESHWDCEWYWGCGYVETFTNNRNPEQSRDIESHEHLDSFIGQMHEYNFDLHKYVETSYAQNINESPRFKKTVFTDDESWAFTELVRQMYLLRGMADFCHKENPGCHVTTSPVDHGNMKNWYDKINKVMLPKVFKEMERMLTPTPQESEQYLTDKKGQI